MNKVVLCTLLTLSLTACSPSSVSDRPVESMTISQPSGQIDVPYDPKNVVVLDFGVLDSLVALGLGDRVVAIPDLMPAYLNGRLNSPVRTGSMKEPDLAVIAQQQPELILTGRRQDGSRVELATIAPTLDMEIRSGDDYMTQFERNVERLGDIFGKRTEARQQLSALKLDLQESRALVSQSGKKTLVLIHNEGRFIPIEQPVVYDLLQAPRVRAKETLPTGQRPAPITLAAAAALKPDRVFIIDRSAAIGAPTLNPNLLEGSPLDKPGVRTVYLDPSLWYLSGAGLISLERQIQAITDAYR